MDNLFISITDKLCVITYCRFYLRNKLGNVSGLQNYGNGSNAIILIQLSESRAFKTKNKKCSIKIEVKGWYG